MSASGQHSGQPRCSQRSCSYPISGSRPKRRLFRCAASPGESDGELSSSPSLTDESRVNAGSSLPVSDRRGPGPDLDGGRSPPFTILKALALGGLAETAYLTWAKVFAAPVACPTSGSCETVLSSGYSELFGVPLSAFGLLAYCAALSTAISWDSGEKPNQGARRNMLLISTVLASTSSYLLYTLFTKFPGDSCVWCLTSAALSLGILGTTLSTFTVREASKVAPTSLGLAAVVLVSLNFLWSDVPTDAFVLEYQESKIESPSPPGARELARQLREAGAKMYGAFWCPHCEDQREAFGREAMADFPYVECFPDGLKPGVGISAVCKEAGVENLPTWVINGRKVEGEQSFNTLRSMLETSQPAAAITNPAQ